MIDLVRKAWFQIAEWIIGESCQMQDAIKTDKVIHHNVSYIFSDGRHIVDLAARRDKCSVNIDRCPSRQPRVQLEPA